MASSLHFRSVLITGASAGLGEEFARQLAGSCDQLILIARREDRLLSLSSDLKAAFPELDVLHFAVDLVNREERTKFIQLLEDHGAKPDLIVNNAGMGDYGEFAEQDWAKVEQMLELNINALTQLTHALIPSMIEKNAGDIINVSSLASVLPIPDFAVYAASKAYVSSFSEAIRIELKDFNINVQALCPGPVHTEFGEVAMRGKEESRVTRSELFYVDKVQVVAEALAGLQKKKARVYPGWKIGLTALALSAIPLVGLRLIMGTRPRKR